MMMTLKEVLKRQKDNINKIPNNTKYMIIDKEDLAVVATLTRDDIANDRLNIDDSYMEKGLLSAKPSRELECVILTITDIPESEKPMFI